ncbi:MAG: hypothetical protein WC584_03875 [Candidatus Pacearchaeota archaeon]
MVLFEGVWFDPFREDIDLSNLSDKAMYNKFKSDLMEVLIRLEDESLKAMCPYFSLSSSPKPVEIKFPPLCYLPGFNRNFISLPFNISCFRGWNNCQDSLIEIGSSLAHESGHYLHCSINPEIYKMTKKKGVDEWYFVETVAELSALAFFDLTDRKLPKIMRNGEAHPLIQSIYEFYHEKGIEYCLNFLGVLTKLSPEKINLDLYKIKKRTREIESN